MQAYSDPKRERDPYALPDLEVFHSSDYPPEDGAEPLEDGWYYWYCFPGCLPDSEPNGPYKSEREALRAARREARG